MADYSKLEGRITLSSAQGLTVWVGGVGTASLLIPAQECYLRSTGTGTSSLLGIIDSFLVGVEATFGVTLDDAANNAGGKVTFQSDPEHVITWTSTDLRDRLGFTGSVSTSVNGISTGAEQAEYLFLPPVKRTQPMAPDGYPGYAYGDGSFIVSPSGKPKVLAYNTLYKDNLQFDYVLGSKAYIDLEAITNASWEKFWTTVVPAGFVFRYHKDRNVDGTYVTYVGMSVGDMNLTPMFDQLQQVWGASGAFRIQVPVVKKV